MNSRAFTLASRAIRPSPQRLALRTPMQRRFASSDQQQPLNLAQFYKTFTRPVAKVILMAFFTYQLAYWGWAKLEQDEIMTEREAYIAELEDEIYWLTGTPVGSAAIKDKEAKTADDSVDHVLQDYQRQLRVLEERNKQLLTAIAQAETGSDRPDAGQTTTSEKKPSSWWKLW